MTELKQPKRESLSLQRSTGASNVRQRCGVIRARDADCLTDPGLVCSTVASRPERGLVVGGATAELYEAGEGVSAALARITPQRHT
jgi:hypothetical protein